MTGPVLLARIRMPVFWTAIVFTLLAVFALDAAVWIAFVLYGLWLVAFALYFFVRTRPRPPVEVRLPLTGRWSALNSPADRVPSHGVNAYGQTYAIDFVHEPVEGARPGFGWWPPARRPTDFPAFGREVLAPADGTVVRRHTWERDHWSRTSWVALIYMLVEGMAREFSGPSRILGNHVVIDIGGNTFAVLAHLKRGSVRVAVGDRVRAGDVVARCGNSGNSSEPHLHLQLMDHRRILFAAGVPMEFTHYEIQGEARRGVPANATPFVA